MIENNLIGYHESRNYNAWKEAYSEGVRLFQVMLGAPQTLKSRPLENPYKDITLVAHGPYVTSLVADINSKLFNVSVSYYKELTINCAISGIKYLVVHVGGKGENRTEKEADYSLETFITKWLLECGNKGVTLCIENDAGSKNGSKCGSLSFLCPIISEYYDSGIRLCFDTEHAYANGLSLKKSGGIKKALELAEVVHLNAVPVYVERGSHLDRHSDTTFDTSHYKEDVYRGIVELMKQSPNRYKVVLERAEWEIAKADYMKVREWNGN